MVKMGRDFVNGLAFGVTQIIPGVSGGTIAIILGFYGELIETVNHFTKDYRKYLRFLVPFLTGVGAGILLFSSIISYLLAEFSFPTMLFFIGLIVGIIPVVFSKVKEPGAALRAGDIAAIAAPAILLLVISGLRTPDTASPAEIIERIGIAYMAFFLFAGIIAAASLVVPGISGSFVLLLLGVYPLATYSLSSIRHWLGDITNLALFLDICKVLAPLGIGIVIGGLSMARLIEGLLTHYHKLMYSVILGLLLGSIYVLFREPIVFQSGTSPVIIAVGAVLFLLGCAVSYRLGRKRL